MRIQSFRMFTPPPPPQFPWLKSQKLVLCHQAWGGRVTFIQFLDHQSPLMPQPDKQRAPPRSSPPLASALLILLSAHSPTRDRSAARSHSPGQSLPRPTDSSARLRLPPPSPPQLTVDWSVPRYVTPRRLVLANQRALLWLTHRAKPSEMLRRHL